MCSEVDFPITHRKRLWKKIWSSHGSEIWNTNLNSGKRPGSIGTKWSHCQQKTTSMVKWWSNVCFKKSPVEMANKQVIEMPQNQEKDVSANDCFQVQISKWSNLDKEERIHYAYCGWYLYFWSLKTQIFQGNLLGKTWQTTYIGTS